MRQAQSASKSQQTPAGSSGMARNGASTINAIPHRHPATQCNANRSVIPTMPASRIAIGTAPTTRSFTARCGAASTIQTPQAAAAKDSMATTNVPAQRRGEPLRWTSSARSHRMAAMTFNDGRMAGFRSTSCRSEATWARVLSSFSISQSATFHKSVYDPTIRTYLDGNSADRITLKTNLPDLYPKISPGSVEADLLRRCEGIPGVPSVRWFRETTAACVLSMDRLEGHALQDAINDLTIVQASGIVARLLRTTLAISWRGIAHNDILPRNIMVGSHDQPYLVDFDHQTNRLYALFRNVLGLRTGQPMIDGSWLPIAARLSIPIPATAWRNAHADPFA